MRGLLYFFIFLIIYGSLFPFRFDPGSYHQGLLTPLFDFHPAHSSRGDIVANILLFIPFGFLATLVYPGGNRTARVAMVLLTGFILAYLVQVAQLIVPGRTPSGSDAIWNLLGCAVGCALARLPLPRALRMAGASGTRPPIPVILGLLWIAYNLAPFVPSIDLQLLKNNLKLIVSSPINPVWVFQKAVMWLVIFHFLRNATGPLARERYYPLIMLATITLSLFIVGHVTTAEHVIGGLLAIPLWLLIRRRERPALLAILLAVAVLATTFLPFELRETSGRFHWIPFSGALAGNMLINVMATFSKLVIYGSLIWLLVEAGLALRSATISVALLLLASEGLQVLFRGPTPEVTDSLLAIIAGVTFHFYARGIAGTAAGGRAITRPGSSPGKDNTGARRSAQAGRRLQLNLHRYQAAFLADTQKALGWDRHQLCEALLTEHHDERPAVMQQLDSVEIGPDVRFRDPDWVALNVKLSNAASTRLGRLASEQGRSESQTLRRLIDAQIVRLGST